MNIGGLIVLFKLLKDAGAVSPFVIGPPAPDNGNDIPGSFCYRTDGKWTWACYRKYVDPAASYNDYQDYLTGN